MLSRLRFLYNRICERLWVRPLAMAIFSVGLVFAAGLADGSGLENWTPDISTDTLETLLTIMASSMMVIATFCVASMVSAYASAGNTATPRTFPVIVADDVSQNALSAFIGSFIFSIVALTALKNSLFEPGGRFALLSFTLILFTLVILMFMRWVDRIARLGRLSTTIDKVEEASARVFKRRKREPYLGGVPLSKEPPGKGHPIRTDTVGYIQQIDMALLQDYAEAEQATVYLAALPGSFATPEKELARIYFESGGNHEIDRAHVMEAFRIRDSRTMDEDPRFCLIVLSEIASRALSPAVNDPGTAIDVIGRMLRLFLYWTAPVENGEETTLKYNRVHVPVISHQDLFEDAFRPIARDGAGMVEVGIRLQKAFRSLAALNDPQIAELARKHSLLALEQARKKLQVPQHVDTLTELALVTELKWRQSIR